VWLSRGTFSVYPVDAVSDGWMAFTWSKVAIEVVVHQKQVVRLVSRYAAWKYGKCR